MRMIQLNYNEEVGNMKRVLLLALALMVTVAFVTSGFAQEKAAAPVSISSDEEFNALPSGAEFIAPDGSHRKKP